MKYILLIGVFFNCVFSQHILKTSKGKEVSGKFISESGTNVKFHIGDVRDFKFPKGEFSHLALVFDKGKSDALHLLKNGTVINSSLDEQEFERLDFINSVFFAVSDIKIIPFGFFLFLALQ